MLSVFGFAASNGPGSEPILYNMRDYIAFIAGVTMIIGNVVALKQSNIKRMFAYSSIAHAGYILVAFATMSSNLFYAIWFYLLAYLFMNLGALAVIQLVEAKTGGTRIADYAGLYRRSPLLAVAMAILLVALAGFPGTAGFIGKMNIFIGAFIGPEPYYVLASVMIATTVVSYFYYFGIMTQMFFRPAVDESKFTKVPVGILVVIIVAVAASVLFGIAPNIAVEFVNNHFNQFLDFIQ
jgi:NADH-quinone oxidoreductase subunit N